MSGYEQIENSITPFEGTTMVALGGSRVGSCAFGLDYS